MRSCLHLFTLTYKYIKINVTKVVFVAGTVHDVVSNASLCTLRWWFKYDKCKQQTHIYFSSTHFSIPFIISSPHKYRQQHQVYSAWWVYSSDVKQSTTLPTVHLKKHAYSSQTTQKWGNRFISVTRAGINTTTTHTVVNSRHLK